MQIMLKKALLILESDTNCINKSTELMSSCRHRNNFFINKLESRQNLYRIIILVQNRFF